MPKAKIKSLTLEGFRGALDPVRIAFDKGESLALFGNNGDGKSSIADAVEWFFCDSISHLGFEGCSRDDYFNKMLPPQSEASVQVSFTEPNLDSTRALRRRGGSDHSNTNTAFVEFMGAVAQERVLLRHQTMRGFVDMTKTQKLEDVSTIVGYGTVSSIRNEMVRAKNAVEKHEDLKKLQGMLSERANDLRQVIGAVAVSEQSVLTAADKLRSALGWTVPITDIIMLRGANETASQQLQASDQGKLVTRLSGIQEAVGTVCTAQQALESVERILLKHNQLAAEQKTVEASVLAKLYEAANDLFTRDMVIVGECPLCGSTIDSEVLADRLIVGLAKMRKALADRQVLLQQITPVESTVAVLTSALDEVLKRDNSDVIGSADDLRGFVGLRAWIASWSAALRSVKSSPDGTELPPSPSIMWQMVERETDLLQSVIGKLKASALGDEKQRQLLQNLMHLRQLADVYPRYCTIERRIAMFERQISFMQIICDAFERAEREGLESVLNAVSADVDEYFSTYLHPDDNIKSVRLVPTAARGVEFQIHFHGQPISPPRRVLSESHLNSLGICLFLASAKRFNKCSGFVLLDDIVSSFDANHRRMLARLLRDKFSEVQVILLTHDDLWFESLQGDLVGANWLFREIGKWTRNGGIQLLPFTPASQKAEIRSLLDTNKVDLAANACRILIEGTLKSLCDDLGVTGLEFREGKANDLRDPAELIDALANYLKANNSLRLAGQKQLFNDIRADKLLTNIGSHHRNLGATGLKRGDIEVVIADQEEFERLFMCPTCQKRPRRLYSPRNAKLKQCQCGALRI